MRRCWGLLLVCCLPLIGADAVDQALAAWDAEAMKARQTYDSALARSDEKALKALQTLAKSAARKGDIAAATEAWTAVLEINRADPEAVEFFTALGTLDKVLAALDEAAKPRDLLGNPVASEPTMPTDAPVATIGAQAGRGYPLGALRAGQRIMVQYVEGSWNPRIGQGMRSPDDGTAGAANRLVLIDTNAPDEPLAVIPTGTADKPAVVTVPRTVPHAALRIAQVAGNAVGEVRYRVGVLP